MSEKKLYNNVINNYLNYKTISLKYAAEYDNGKESTSFSGTLRIRKDSVIWISITPALGIELFRIQLTTDSLKFMNRTNSEYFVSDYDYILKKYQFDFDYNDIQTLLTDELFIYNECEPNANNEDGKLLSHEELRKTFKSYADSNLYVLQTERKRKIKKYIKKNKANDFIVQLIYINGGVFKISKESIIDYSDKKSLDIQYSDFIDLNQKVFPTKIEMDFNNNDKKTKVNLKYSKIIIDNILNYPFNIPESYKEIKL